MPRARWPNGRRAGDIHLRGRTDACVRARSFDMIISRFGVMFFDDPVQAFANLRRAVRAGGATAIRRLAQSCGESIHDDGRTRRGAAAAESPAAPAG